MNLHEIHSELVKQKIYYTWRLSTRCTCGTKKHSTFVLGEPLMKASGDMKVSTSAPGPSPPRSPASTRPARRRGGTRGRARPGAAAVLSTDWARSRLPPRSWSPVKLLFIGFSVSASGMAATWVRERMSTEPLMQATFLAMTVTSGAGQPHQQLVLQLVEVSAKSED